jgi:hypothetical protein
MKKQEKSLPREFMHDKKTAGIPAVRIRFDVFRVTRAR